MLRLHPVPGKAKSTMICEAFAAGAPRSAEGDVFYGVTDANRNAWDAAQGGDWYYIDNSYFDASRGTHYRVTRGALQHSGSGRSDGRRFSALDVEVKPWRAHGRHIVVCIQSESFMRFVGEPDWFASAMFCLRKTRREIRIREWSADKLGLARTLDADLEGAQCLVTHSSAAAVTATLAGVPAVCTAQCAATPVAWSIDESDWIDPAARPEDRSRWAGVLADNQWTLDEMRSGKAWAAIGRR